MRINHAALLFFHKEQANEAGGTGGSYWPPTSMTQVLLGNGGVLFGNVASYQPVPRCCY